MSRTLSTALRGTAIAMALAGLGAAQAATAVWTGASTGEAIGGSREHHPGPNPYWDDDGNWATGRPNAGDVVQLGAFDSTIRSGSWTLASLSGTGKLEVSGGLLAVTGSGSVGRLVLSGGDIGGSGRLTLAGLDWQSGSMGSTTRRGGVTAVNGPATLSGSSLVLNYGRSLELDGDTLWTSSGTLTINGAGNAIGETRTGQPYGASSVSLAAGKTLTVSSAGSHVIAGDGVFNNAGTVVVAAGNAGLTLGSGFVNAGTVDARQGSTLVLPTVFINPGRLTGGGIFSVGTLANAGHIAPGDSLGQLHIEGSLLQTAAGVLDVELQGPGAFDQLKVVGTTTLGGTLNLVCHADCSLSAGQSFMLLDGLPGQLQGSFSQVALSGFGRGAFDVVYDRANGNVLLNVLQAAAPVPEPGVALLFATGLLALAWRRRQGSPSQ